MFGNGLRVGRVLAPVAAGLSLMLAAGCVSSTRPASVPGDAAYEVGGRDRVAYQTPVNGTLYISDQDRNALLYSGPVLSGDRIVVDPAADRVSVNGHVVVSENVNHADHRIYVLAGPPPAAPVVSASARLTAPVPMAVPTDATLAAEGRDRVAFTASGSGVVWVMDATRNIVVYSGRVLGGDRVVVDPARDSMTVNGTRAYNANLPAGDYRIYFAPGAEPVVAPGAVPAPPAIAAPAEVGIRLPAVPTSAVVLTESSALGTVTAARSGMVWVTDAATRRTVFSGHIRQGDTLVVDPGTGRITLNAVPVAIVGIVPGRYRVWFQSGT